MQDILPVIGVEVGKHLGNVQNALPLRSVCRDWRDLATLTSVEADLDLEPDAVEQAASRARKELFYRRCPRIRKLTYHVSPGVSLAKFEATMLELCERLNSLEELVLLFNNPGQQFESRHLAVLRPLHSLKSLTLQANFHPEACSFSVLSSLTRLSCLTVLPSEASTGLTDSHVSSLAALGGLASLDFPGHARAFTGATLVTLAALPCLHQLVVRSNKPQAIDYTLALPALAGLRAITRRPTSKATPLHLEVGVPDAAFGTALLRAVAGPGLSQLMLAVRDAAGSSDISTLLASPCVQQQLAGLDLEFRAAPTPEDVSALAACTALQRLHLTCKCPRAPATKLDWAAWLSLRQLRHLHVHINPAWRAPLQPATLAAMAAAWPHLNHLHLRLSPSDNATHALDLLEAFKELRSLSLTWLGQAGPAVGSAGAGGLRRRGSGSLDGASFCLGSLPSSLEELSLTSISTVRLAVPRSAAFSNTNYSSSTFLGPADPAAAAAAAALTSPVLPNLHSLVMDGNFGMSDELLAGLVAHTPYLASLTLVLAGRQTLSGTGLAAVAQQVPQLSSLLLSDYRESPLCLNQACLCGLAATGGFAKLRHLKLSTPDVVHAELLPTAFAGFSKLRRLDLVGCQDQAAAALGSALPLCCIKHASDWAADGMAAAALANAAAAQEGQQQVEDMAEAEAL